MKKGVTEKEFMNLLLDLQKDLKDFKSDVSKLVKIEEEKSKKQQNKK